MDSPAMGPEAMTGTIGVEKTAELVLLDADPLANIRNTRRIALAMTRGRLPDWAALDGLLARAEAAATARR